MERVSVGERSNRGDPVMNEPKETLIINPAAGLERVAAGIVAKLHPMGREIWDRGLGDVVRRVIKQNPDIKDQDFTVADLAERVGILKPERKRGRRR